MQTKSLSGKPIILHQKSEQNELSEVKGTKKGIKILPVCIWMGERASVCVFA
jgi:hypothetical protein